MTNKHISSLLCSAGVRYVSGMGRTNLYTLESAATMVTRTNLTALDFRVSSGQMIEKLLFGKGRYLVLQTPILVGADEGFGADPTFCCEFQHFGSEFFDIMQKKPLMCELFLRKIAHIVPVVV